MSEQTRRRWARAAVWLTAALALSGCAASPSESPASSRSAGAEPGAPSGTAQKTPGDPTCPSIVTKGTVDALTAAGWKPRQDPFYVGNIQLSGGIQCTWGNASTVSDHVQMYGWAPADATQSRAAQQELIESGWKRVEQGGAVYLTAPEGMIVHPDDDGFGMTYRFDDGQVTVSDTKQGLVLITWPARR